MAAASADLTINTPHSHNHTHLLAFAYASIGAEAGVDLGWGLYSTVAPPLEEAERQCTPAEEGIKLLFLVSLSPALSDKEAHLGAVLAAEQVCSSCPRQHTLWYSSSAA